MVFESTPVRAGSLANWSLNAPAFSKARSVNVTMPLLALTVTVPFSGVPALLSLAVTVVELSVVTMLPDASTMARVVCG